MFYYRDKTWIHICYFLIKALLHHHNQLNWRPTRRQLLTFRIVVTQTVELALSESIYNHVIVIVKHINMFIELFFALLSIQIFKTKLEKHINQYESLL